MGRQHYSKSRVPKSRVQRAVGLPGYRGHSVAGLLIALLLAAAISGCTGLAGPDYQRPELAAKPEWRRGDTSPNAADVIQHDWWTGFEDRYLNELIGRAIKDDIDLRILAARIEVARVRVQSEGAGTLPKFNLDASKTLTRQAGQAGVSRSYSALVNPSWEVDIWGRVSKGLEAEVSQFKATEADWRAGYLTLVSDVANKYFEIGKLDQQISQQNTSIGMNQKILLIYANQYREGMIPESKLIQQKAETNSLRKELLEQQRLRKVAENNLATLLGMPAGEFQLPSQVQLDAIRIPDVPIGLPSDLLSRRPDIVAKELLVLAAHQKLGQARLARLPKFSLTGSGGLSSAALSALLNNWSLSLVPSLAIPIFDPTIKIDIKANEAATKVAEEEYRKTVMKAFEEVENALVNLSSHKRQQQQLSQRLEHLNLVNHTVHSQLREGMVSELQVLESERSLLSARLGMAEQKQQILLDTVALYKTLGGGWEQQDLLTVEGSAVEGNAVEGTAIEGAPVERTTIIEGNRR